MSACQRRSLILGGVDRYGDGAGCKPVALTRPGGSIPLTPTMQQAAPPRWRNLADALVSEASCSRFESGAWHHRRRSPTLAEAPGREPGQCGFESRRRHHGSVAQSAEAADSKPAKCRFESCRSHQKQSPTERKLPVATSMDDDGLARWFGAPLNEALPSRYRRLAKSMTRLGTKS